MIGIVAVTLVVGGWVLVGRDGGVPRGRALLDQSEGGITQPLEPGQPVTLGVVRTANTSDEPVELVSARLVRLDPTLELLGFSAMPYGGVPLTALEHPLPGAVALEDFPPQPPADDYQFVVLFALRLRPGETAGWAAGIELLYRQGGELRRQLFKDQVHVCIGIDGGDCADMPKPQDIDELLRGGDT